MHRSTKLKITDLNPHLMCTLCGGYFIDATTIIECLHSFCRSCIVKYLENNKFCPVCEVQVHKTRPLLNIRSDQTLQDIVYKLVPGLYKNEMGLRRDFYTKHPEAVPANPEDRGETLEKFVYSPDETISLSLEYTADSVYKEIEEELEEGTARSRRFLRCPAAVTVALLKKLVRGKYGLSPSHPLDLIYGEESLSDEYSLIDVAYIYLWRRKGPMSLKYRIYELVPLSEERQVCKKLKLASIGVDPILAKNNNEEKDVCATQTLPCKGPDPTLVDVKCIASEIETNETETDSATEPWKEVQLKISESGVMSVLNVEVCLPPSSNASDSDILATVLSSGKSKDFRENEEGSNSGSKVNRDSKKCNNGKAPKTNHTTVAVNKKKSTTALTGGSKATKLLSKTWNPSTSRVAVSSNASNTTTTSTALKRPFSAVESSVLALSSTSSTAPLSQPSAPKAPRFFKARIANAQQTGSSASKPLHTYQGAFPSTARNKDKNKPSKTNKEQPAGLNTESSKPTEATSPNTAPQPGITINLTPTTVTHSSLPEKMSQSIAPTLQGQSNTVSQAKPNHVTTEPVKETSPKTDGVLVPEEKNCCTPEPKKQTAVQHVELVIPKIPEMLSSATTTCVTATTHSPTSRTTRPPTPFYPNAAQSPGVSTATSRASSPLIPRPSSAPAIPKPGQRRPMVNRPLTPGPLTLTTNGKAAKSLEAFTTSDTHRNEPAKVPSPLRSPVPSNCSPLRPSPHGWLSPPLARTSRSSNNLGKAPVSPLVAPQSPSHLTALQQHHALTRSPLSFLPRGPLPAHLFPNFIHPPHLPYLPTATHMHLSQASLSPGSKLNNLNETATSSNASMSMTLPISSTNQMSPKSGANVMSSCGSHNPLTTATSVAWSAINRTQPSPSHYSLSSLMANPVMSLPNPLGLQSFAKTLNTALLSPLSREAQNQQRIMDAFTGSFFSFPSSYPDLLQANAAVAAAAAASVPKTDPKLRPSRTPENLVLRPTMASPLGHPYFSYGYHSSLPPTVTTLANTRSHDPRSNATTTPPMTSSKPLSSRRPPPLVPLLKKSSPTTTTAQTDTVSPSKPDHSATRSPTIAAMTATASKDDKVKEKSTSASENTETERSPEQVDKTKLNHGEAAVTAVSIPVSQMVDNGLKENSIKNGIAEQPSDTEQNAVCNGATTGGSEENSSDRPAKEGLSKD